MPFYIVNENNINKINNITKPSVVRVHSLSCYWCKLMTPEFNKFKNNKILKNINIFDIETHHLSKINLPFVKTALNNGVPQLYIINKNGEILKEYKGDRTSNDMFNFSKELIKKQKVKTKKISKQKKKKLKSRKVLFNLKKNKFSKKNNIFRSLTPWNY